MKIQNGMLCPVCELGNLAAVNKNLSFNYKGNETVINSNVYVCPECAEECLEPDDQKAIDKKLTAVRRQIDGLLSPDEIRKIRKKFGYTQVAFADFLHVGEKNFARYENGKTTQSRSMDNLLRILNHSPIAIEILGGEFPRQNHSNEIIFEVMTPIKKKQKAVKYSFNDKNFDGNPKACSTV